MSMPASIKARMSRSKNVATRAGYLLVKTASRIVKLQVKHRRPELDAALRAGLSVPLTNKLLSAFFPDAWPRRNASSVGQHMRRPALPHRLASRGILVETQNCFGRCTRIAGRHNDTSA